MKISLSYALYLTGFLFAIASTSLQAEDWTTIDGKSYSNVSVVKAEPDAVTILHHDGGARVPLANLPADLQKRFNFDPATARVAAENRAKAEAENSKALQAEFDQAREQRQAKFVAENPPIQSLDPSPIANEPTTASTPTGPVDPTHHSMSDLVDVTKRLKDDHPDVSHNSMTSLKMAAQYLGPDLSDPAHHSTASLVSAAHTLGPDPADPTHHSMSQLFSADPLARP